MSSSTSSPFQGGTNRAGAGADARDLDGLAMDAHDVGALATDGRSLDAVAFQGLHVAVIMDGNGRWARTRGKPRSAGHVAGTRTVRRLVEAAPGLGIGTLTLYAFSADNWRRPRGEVAHLMRLFGRHLRSERDRCVETGVRLDVIGRRTRLPTALLRRIDDVEFHTRRGERLHLRLAIDYSARNALMDAAALLGGGTPLSREVFARAVARAVHAPPGTRDVDLLIRTGGEQRLSDFLLWESAYAELLFTDVLWPDFEASHLDAALEEFARRERRFGGLAPATTVTPRRGVQP